MDYSALVSEMQRLGQGSRQFRSLAGTKPPGRQEVRKSNTFNQLADKIGEVIRLADLVQSHNRRMVKLCHTCRFA